MSVIVNPDTTLFGWARPFDPYDPDLPVRVVLHTAGGTSLSITAGCKLSTLIAALQARGMKTPGDDIDDDDQALAP